jgi:hypothetical protein
LHKLTKNLNKQYPFDDTLEMQSTNCSLQDQLSAILLLSSDYQKHYNYPSEIQLSKALISLMLKRECPWKSAAIIYSMGMHFIY